MTDPKTAPTLREHLAARAAAILDEGRQAMRASQARAAALQANVTRLEASSLSHVLDAPAHEFRAMFELLVSNVSGVQAPAVTEPAPQPEVA